MDIDKELSKAIKALLTPLVRLLIRSGVGVGTLVEWVKLVYVAVADKDFPDANGKQSVSRISTLTGMHRKDVAKFRAMLAENNDSGKASLTQNRAQRVINAWLNTAMYLDRNGKPLPLPMKGNDFSFFGLVNRASGDIYPTAILDELLMSGIVDVTDTGDVRLLKSGYIPNENFVEKLGIFGKSSSDFLGTMDHNLNPLHDSPRMQMSVAYPNIDEKTIKEFEAYSRQEATDLLVKLNAWLAERANNPGTEDDDQPKRRVGFGIYYFEE